MVQNVNDFTDQQLLRDYAGHRPEAAFAELVRRHVDLVYPVAVRMICDSHLAKAASAGNSVAVDTLITLAGGGDSNVQTAAQKALRLAADHQNVKAANALRAMGVIW